MPEGEVNRPTAFEMAARQREISVSEFFLKNRHLLGFDSTVQGRGDDSARGRRQCA